MSGNQVRPANGEAWTWEQFLDHYFNHTGSGSPTPVAGPPLPVYLDRSWYMDEGPRRYYHPGMFPIIKDVLERKDLAPGAYDLWQLAPKGGDDPSAKASISHYTTDNFSKDWWTRAFVFGNESARISGQVMVNPDGSKTFHNVEIRPYDTDFNFNNKNGGGLLEIVCGWGRREYDPDNLGISYDMRFPPEGRGRVYFPFTDSQLNAEMQNPKAAPPGLLPSVASAPPPFLDQYRQYQDQMGANPSPTPAPRGMGSSTSSFAAPNSFAGSSVGSIPSLITGVAGVDSTMQPAPLTPSRPLGLVSRQPMPDWPIPPPIFNMR